jgi:predicted metal-dependent hydrolase
MNNSKMTPPPIIPREKLDFGLDGDIPQYWLNGDPFKTRFFDALSTLFPVGERFFITCVRDFKDRTTDPKMLQGIAVDAILQGQEKRLFGIIRQHTSREFTLGITAAAEHITAIMADCFVERPQIFEGADERIRALYIWHAMEEMEHKAVAFDVLQDVAHSSYGNRIGSMLLVTLLFPFHVFRIMKRMLQVDGFSRWQRTKIWAQGLWWLYKPGGLFSPMVGKYFSYLKPGFHPWQEPVVPSYDNWLRLLKETGDPIQAGNHLHGVHA